MNVGDSMFTVFALIPFLIYFGIIILTVYFIVKTVKFMDAKIELDREKNEKIDQLIQAVKQEKNL